MKNNIIHWFPGHMKKAFNKINDFIKKVNIIIEVVDARAPKQSSNNFLKKIIPFNKIHILVCMKSDLADLKKIKYNKNIIFISNKNRKSINQLINKIDKIKSLIIKKIMIIGMPNVGKSSLINLLTNKKVVKVENKPGVTRNIQWINFKNKFYLLDTPGILPSNYNDSNYVLGLIGVIKFELLPIIDLSDFAYYFIIKNYANLYKIRYGEIKKTSYEAFEQIAEKKHIKNDKSLNYELTRYFFLKEIRDGKIGKIFFE